MKLVFLLVTLAILTYLSRVFPFFFNTKNWHPYILEMIKFMPVAILSAIVFTPILYNKDELQLALTNDTLISSIITLLIAYLTKNMMITIIAGVFVAIILHHFF